MTEVCSQCGRTQTDSSDRQCLSVFGGYCRWVTVTKARTRRSLETQQAITSEIAVTALQRVEELIDADCDETGGALYNPRATVRKVRDVLEEAKAKLEALQLGETVSA